MVTWLTWETHTTYDSIYYCTHESSTRSRFKQRPSTTFVLHETQRGEKSALILANKTITANKRDILRWCQASSVDHKNGSPIGNGWSVCLCRHLLWFATIDKALTGLMFDAWSTSDASPSLIRSCPVRFSFDRPLFIWISLVLPISLISDSLLDSVLSTGKLWETQRHFADHLHKPQRYHPLKVFRNIIPVSLRVWKQWDLRGSRWGILTKFPPNWTVSPRDMLWLQLVPAANPPRSIAYLHNRLVFTQVLCGNENAVGFQLYLWVPDSAVHPMIS